MWSPLAKETEPAYGKAAALGDAIRAELAADNPKLLVLDREFDTQSVDPMFLEPESGLAWYNKSDGKLELVLGVQSPYEAAESIAFLLGKAARRSAGAYREPFRLCRRRLRRPRPHHVHFLHRAGGDVLSRPPGAPGA